MSGPDEDGTQATQAAIEAVHQKLHEIGYEDATVEDAAVLFIRALEGVMTHVTDPRELGGAIAGPGGPFDHGQNVIDARRALLVDYQEAATLDSEEGQQEQVFALSLAGRVNRTPDRATVILLGNLDFLAATITELHGVAERIGMTAELHAACAKRWGDMPHPGERQ